MSNCNERSGSHGAVAAALMMNEPDFHLSDYGSFAFLTPVSEYGCNWSDANLPDATVYNSSLVIEPRYLGDILEGISAAALVVKTL